MDGLCSKQKIVERKGECTQHLSTKGNEIIEITCSNCGHKINDWKNIFEGVNTSYECPRCENSGYAWNYNTRR